MSRSVLNFLAAAAFFAAGSATAATPASGTLTDSDGPVTFTGGPYVVPNLGAIQGEIPLVATDCDVPQGCDSFALKVAIADKFRTDKKNEKEIVQIVMTITPSAEPAGQATDVDIYLLDSAGEEVGSATDTRGVLVETINVPLKTLKDGDYTVLITPGVPLASSIDVNIHIGRGDKSGDVVEGKSGDGLLLGAFGFPALLSLFGLALIRSGPARSAGHGSCALFAGRNPI